MGRKMGSWGTVGRGESRRSWERERERIGRQEGWHCDAGVLFKANGFRMKAESSSEVECTEELMSRTGLQVGVVVNLAGFCACRHKIVLVPFLSLYGR